MMKTLNMLSPSNKWLYFVSVSYTDIDHETVSNLLQAWVRSKLRGCSLETLKLI